MEKSSRYVMAKVQDCGLEISELELHSLCYIHFQTNILGNVWTSLYSQLKVK